MIQHVSRIALAIGAVLAILSGFALTVQAQTGRPVSVTARPVAMHTPARPDAEPNVGRLHFLAGMELTAEDDAFGGLSGLAVSADGRRALAITDRGQWVALEFELEDGLPRGIAAVRMAPLLDPDGEPLEGVLSDAEALLIDDDAVLVAFEGRHRLHRYPAARPIAEPEMLFAAEGSVLQLPLAARRQPRNGGIEAMIRTGQGRLLLLSERAEAADGGHRAWLWTGRGGGDSLTFAVPDRFAPTDAARLPDGDLLVLLRHYSPLTGAAAKLMRIAAEAIAPDARLTGEELAVLRRPLSVDNMEALAVRRDAAGRLLVYMVSDDNFRSGQRTLLLVYALEETEAGTAGE